MPSGGHNKLGDRSEEARQTVAAVEVREEIWYRSANPEYWTRQRIYSHLAKQLFRSGITKHELAASAVTRLSANHYALAGCLDAIEKASEEEEPKFSGKCAYERANFFAKQITDTLKDLGIKPDSMKRDNTPKEVASEPYEIVD